jgi:hypothetical protein
VPPPRLRPLLLVLTLPPLLAGCDAGAAPPRDDGAARAPVATEWEPRVEMGGELYPSFLLATATVRRWDDGPRVVREKDLVGDVIGVLGARVVAPRDGARVRLEVDAPAFVERSSVEAVLARKGDVAELYPSVAYDWNALLRVEQPQVVNVTFRLYVDGAPVGEEVRPVGVRSVNDAPWEMERDGERTDLSWMFAAYVNENHPRIDGILREALDHHAIEAFVGYGGTPDDVYEQVYAVWNVFQRRDFRYSDINRPSFEASEVHAQHVRFLDEAMTARQANCVDGSVLFASVLRKIGIDPVLVLLPGHMMVGFYLDADHREIAFLETTMLGDEDITALPEDGALPASFTDRVSVETRNQASYRTFAEAVEEGTRLYDEALPKIEAAAPDYALVDVLEARAFGIRPIGR